MQDKLYIYFWREKRRGMLRRVVGCFPEACFVIEPMKMVNSSMPLGGVQTLVYADHMWASRSKLLVVVNFLFRLTSGRSLLPSVRMTLTSCRSPPTLFARRCYRETLVALLPVP